MLYKQFETNKDAETNGIWVQYEDGTDTAPPRFLVRRAGGANLEYAKALEQKVKPYRRQAQAGMVPFAVLERLQREVFCATVIRDWENVQNREGEKIPYNYANAIRVMTDLPDLYADLQSQANNISLFKEAVVEEEAKN